MISLLHLDSDKKFLEKTRRYFDKQGNFSMYPVFSVQKTLTILETRKVDAIVSGQPEGIELLNPCNIPDQHPDPVMRVSKEGVLTYANPAPYLLLEEWGITGESMVDPVKGTFEKALSNGIPLRTEMEAEGSVFQFTFEPEGNKEYVTTYGHH